LLLLGTVSPRTVNRSPAGSGGQYRQLERARTTYRDYFVGRTEIHGVRHPRHPADGSPRYNPRDPPR
jgi:hypothetical protein